MIRSQRLRFQLMLEDARSKKRVELAEEREGVTWVWFHGEQVEGILGSGIHCCVN